MIRTAKSLLRAMYRAETADAEEDERDFAAELVCDPGSDEWWLGNEQVSRAAGTALLAGIYIRNDGGGGGLEHYRLNPDGLAAARKLL